MVNHHSPVNDKGWTNWVRRGIPQQPVHLIQVRVLDLDGQPRYTQPLWLMVCGPLGSVDRQDRWTWIVLLAYWQVLLARDLAQDCPRPWERAASAGPLPLARVQRDYGRIIWQFGLAMPPPKPRGKAPGRPVGTVLQPKARQPVLKRRPGAA